MTGSPKQTEQMSQHTDSEITPNMKRYPWTHAHSLYATMGGFAIDTRDLGCDYLPSGRKRMTLTLDGLKFIAKHDPDLLPDLSASEIMDKSKANMFTKMITIVQAMWFGIQCITRLTQGLSISLLEMNTTIHAACALALYFFFWWDKPLDVEEPTICTHERLHHIAALHVIRTLYPLIDLSLADLQNTDDDEILDSSADSETAVFHPVVQNILLSPSEDPKLQAENCLVYRGFVFHENRELSHHACNTYKELTELDFVRFELASQAVRRYVIRLPIQDFNTFFAVRSRNFSDTSFGVEEPHGKTYAYEGFFLAGLFYGGVHLVVWNRPFRGKIDELLWKLSGISILVSGIPPVISLLAEGFAFKKYYLHSTGIRGTELAKQILHQFCSMFFILFLFLYIFARVFIITECFLDVFHLPDSAFEVPQWSQYFPHIG